jgi:hypothetical protein
MKYLIVLLISFSTFSTFASELNTEAQKNFSNILDVQGKALDRMDREKALPFGFKFNEMITDIAVTKSGLLGLSALKSTQAVEIKWKRKSQANKDDAAADITIHEFPNEEELKALGKMVYQLAKDSGKVRLSHKLQQQINSALSNTNALLNDLKVTQYKNFVADAYRLDLSFSSEGSLWTFASAGVAFRVRLDWKIKKQQLTDEKSALANSVTRLVARTLYALEQGMDLTPLHAFSINRVGVGVGGSYKTGMLGLWKTSIGMMGMMWFKIIPAEKSNVSMPLDIINEGFVVGGEEEDEKLFWRRRSNPISTSQVVTGLNKSLKTAANFAEHSSVNRSSGWQVSDFKTSHDLSYSGLMGLANFSGKTLLEIEFKRK